MEPCNLGPYGPWAIGLTGDAPPTHAFRHPQWTDAAAWREAVRQRLFDRLAMPDLGPVPAVRV